MSKIENTAVTETISVAKAPSKKSLAQAIFATKVAEFAQKLYGSNKDFRNAVLTTIETDLSVSRASAATLYNSFKKDAEQAGTVKLGRDPKKVKAQSTGVRGRPIGSGKKKVIETTETVAEATV